MARWRAAGTRARATTAARAAAAAAAILAAGAGAVAIGTAPLNRPAAAGPARALTAVPAIRLPAEAGLRAYGQHGTGATFTEGDGSYALHLRDGRVVWFFSDSFLGAVRPDGHRGPSVMLHNQIVVAGSPSAARASSFHNVWPNGWGTNAFAAIGCTAEWPAAAIQSSPSQVQVVLRCVDAKLDVLRLDLATVTISSGLSGWTVSIDTANFDSAARVQLPACSRDGTGQVESGQSIMQLGGYSYLYGLQHCGFAVRAYVARVAGRDLSRTGSWQYWDGPGLGWVDRAAGGEFFLAPMTAGGGPLVHAGAEYSVVHDAKRHVYRLIATDLGLGPIIDEYTATRGPAGPWSFRGTIDNTRADGIYGRRPVADPRSPCTRTTYGAKEQPALETHDDVVLSYNVNVSGCPAAGAWAAYQASLANYNPVFRYACGPGLPLVPRICPGPGRGHRQ